MSVGGNDIGFAGIVATCMSPFPDCTALDPVVTSALAALPGKLSMLFGAVPSTVSDVFVTEYPDSTTGLFGLRCGNPLSPSAPGMEGVTLDEAEWASSRVIAPLNAALAAAVAGANAAPGAHPAFHFVTGISARYVSHGYCAGLSLAFWNAVIPRFVNTPIDSLATQGDIMGTMHPNAAGQAAIGSALFDAMRFLLDPAMVAVTTPSTPVAGVPTPVTVTVTNTVGGPLPGAMVTIDGVMAGAANASGVLSTTWVFNAAGSHTVAADLDPYTVGSTTITVAPASYRVSSSPSPIGLGTHAAAHTASHRRHDQPVGRWHVHREQPFRDVHGAVRRLGRERDDQRHAAVDDNLRAERIQTSVPDQDDRDLPHDLLRAGPPGVRPGRRVVSRRLHGFSMTRQ